MRPTPEQIVAALERTGFLLEQRAAQKLDESGFEIIINDAFPDSDTGKSRETDIYAIAYYDPDPDNPEMYVSAHVIVECKNYANPLVVVGKSLASPSFPVDSVSTYFDPLSLRFPDDRLDGSIFGELQLAEAHPDDQTGYFVGYQLVRLELKSGNWSANNTSVHDDVLYPLVKARLYWTKRNREMVGDTDTPWRYPGIDYYFPVLLTAEEIYTVAIADDAVPLVTKVKWTTLRRSFHFQDERTTLRADVVSFESFDEYLRDRVHKTASRACDVIKDNLQFYDPGWLLSNYGRPQNVDLFSEWLKSARQK